MSSNSLQIFDPLPAHFYLAPSSAHRWINCPGSKVHTDGEASGAAERGTLGHKIADQILTNSLVGGRIALTEYDREVYDRMNQDEKDWFKKSIKMCVRYVKQRFTELTDWADSPCTVLYESKIASTSVKEHGGTIDVILATGYTLNVIDFKFGSVGVDADDNDQLMCYLNLARQLYPDCKQFFGTIIQPSYRGVDTVKFTEDGLDSYLDRVGFAATNDELHGDVSWCRYCPALATCPEAARTTVNAVDQFGTIEEVVNRASVPPTESEVYQLERIVMCHKLAKAAYEKASEVLKQWVEQSGVPLTLHRISSTRRRYLKQDVTAEDVLAMMPGTVELDKLMRLKTLTELRELAKMKANDFNAQFDRVLDVTSSPVLKQGSKPTAAELSDFDIPLYDSSEDN